MGDHLVANCPKLNTLDKKVHWNTENPKTHAYRLAKIDKTSENSADKIESNKISASMSRMYPNTESSKRDFGDSSQLTYWVLDSGSTCRMTPDISGFIPCSLVETDKYIEVAYGHFLTVKQPG